jgi:hypothetical protein
MRATARGTATVARHLADRRDVEEAAAGAVVVLEELAATLERALDRVNELRETERAAAA